MCVAPRLCSVATVRIGLAVQALLACLYCAPRALPLLFLGYSLGGACYAVGRVLTVRGHAPTREPRRLPRDSPPKG